MLRRLCVFLFAIASLSALAGCSSSTGDHRSLMPTAPTATSGYGAMSLKLTGSPEMYDHINLDVKEVWVHRLNDHTPNDSLCGWGEGDDSDHDGDKDADSDSGWEDAELGADGHSRGDSDDSRPASSSDGRMHHRDHHGTWYKLDVTPGIYDLLDLQNGVFTTLAVGHVPAGRYDQVRFNLGKDNTIVVDGASHALFVPGGKKPHFYLVGRFQVTGDRNSDIGIDFDACRSIIRIGHGGYLLIPVARIHEIGTTGSIAGRLDPASAVSSVAIMQGADTVATTRSGSDGRFQVWLLPAGSYRVQITPDDPTFAARAIDGVMVTAGQTTNLGVITLTHGSGSGGNIVGTVSPGDVTTIVQAMVDTNVVMTTTAAAGGHFSLSGLPAGIYSVRFTLLETTLYYGRTISNVVVTDGSTTDLGVVTLTPVTPLVGDIIGTVSPGDVATTVDAVSGSTVVKSTTTAAGGSFSLNGLASGTYSVRFTPAGTSYRGLTVANVVVTGGGIADMGIVTLAPVASGTGSVTGRVVPNDVPTKVYLLTSPGDAAVDSTMTAGDGTFGFSNVAAANYGLSLEPVDPYWSSRYVGPFAVAADQTTMLGDLYIGPRLGSVAPATASRGRHRP